MNTKRFMIIMTIASLVIVAVAVLIVHDRNDDGIASVPITSDSAFVGTWSSEDFKDKDENDMNRARITLSEDGTYIGQIGKYDFSGNWQQLDDDNIRLINENGDEAFTGESRDDGLLLKPANGADITSSEWLLTR